MPMILFRIVVGASMLILGRQLFWVFVAGMGAMFGIDVVAPVFPGQPEWMVIVIAIGAGLIGAGLAIVWQWAAAGMAGFLAGGYVVLYGMSVLGWVTTPFPPLPFLLGGILGVILVVALFDWALIVLSSLAGASVIVQTLPLNPVFAPLLLCGLVAVGIAVQASLWRPT